MPISFLDLPGEIRNKIYDHLLISRGPIEYVNKHETKAKNVHPEILRLNRQIHHEARPILYARNILIFNYKTLSQFSRKCSLYLSYVERIRLIATSFVYPKTRDLSYDRRIQRYNPDRALFILSKCTNLRVLSHEFQYPRCNNPLAQYYYDNHVLDKFRKEAKHFVTAHPTLQHASGMENWEAAMTMILDMASGSCTTIPIALVIAVDSERVKIEDKEPWAARQVVLGPKLRCSHNHPYRVCPGGADIHLQYDYWISER